MDSSYFLTQALAVLGTITGIIGCVLGILNYLYDRPKVVVKLIWDMEPSGNTTLDKNQLYACITVANIGRRSTFISHAAIKLPEKNSYGIIPEGLGDEKLAEGDPPKHYYVKQNGLEKYSKDWHKIRACVTDSAGKLFYSKPTSKCPSWAITKKDGS